jgi:methionine-rich copper-binding protein CopC
LIKKSTLDLLSERLKIKIQRTLLLLALSIPLIATSALPANAHTSLELSTPTDGQSIEFMPAELSAGFDEDLIEIEGEVVNTLELESADGAKYVLSAATIAGPTVSASAGDGEYPAGDYLLKYRVVSADGHPVTGEIKFSTQSLTTIGSVPAEAEATPYLAKTEDSSPESALYIAVGLLLALASGLVIKKRMGNGSRN